MFFTLHTQTYYQICMNEHGPTSNCTEGCSQCWEGTKHFFLIDYMTPMNELIWNCADKWFWIHSENVDICTAFVLVFTIPN